MELIRVDNVQKTYKNGVVALYDFNLSELKREFEREKEKAKRSNVVQCPDVTVMEWFNAWFEQYKKPTLKPSSVQAYYRKFKNTYGSMLGNAVVGELNQFAIQTATSELLIQAVENGFSK